MHTLFTVKLAHELPNLLTIFADTVAALRERVPAAGHEDEFQELDDALDSAFAASRELLTLGQAQRTKSGVIDVNDVVARAHPLLRRMLGPAIKVSLDLRATGAMAEVEEVHLEWLLLNLVANARDAMPGGGTLRIET